MKFPRLNIPRIGEYKILLYRILLAYVFYFIARFLFYIYNAHLMSMESPWQFFRLAYHGLAFDTTSILYINSLFIVFSLLPLLVNTTRIYQKILFILYFTTNLIAYATNFIDFIYYQYNFGRSTVAVTESISHESNRLSLFAHFLIRYWHVVLLFILCWALWVWAYKKMKLIAETARPTLKYFLVSLIAFALIVVACIGGIRGGDFDMSTRPINLVDANRFVTKPAQANFVLNTPFAIIRTMFSNNFSKVNMVSEATINSLLVPVKEYHNNPKTTPNVIIFILESNAKEYSGAFNTGMHIPGYKSYTPFLDSLAPHSLVFNNAYANGYKSIHALSSVLAGIPSFKDAFTSSPFPNQPTESLVSVLKSEGYTTSFFHGAANGSMGFLGYSNILGMDKYFGRTEYNNDADFDGTWGIWDEPFFQYFKTELSKQKQPFFSTLFSVSSHEPYVVPKQYEGKFPKGDVNIHQCIGYTDYALRRFFTEAKKEPWFNNTIFVLVGDHSNTIHYPEYAEEMNANSVVMLLYSPTEKYKGIDSSLTQQIDIYPTLLDITGYDKPFRSWGRSLVGDKNIPPFVIRYSSLLYQFMTEKYTCTFDGQKAVGFYAREDKALHNNLIAHRNGAMDTAELRCKAFVQDYMERLIDKRLSGLSNR